MNAIGYVNVLKPDDKEIEEDILIGPSLRVLPKIVGSEIDLSVGAKITESPARTNFRANAHGTVSDGGGLLIIGKSTTANHGTNYAVIVSATMGEKFPSSRR